MAKITKNFTEAETVAISLGAGDMVYPAIQYVSGTSSTWYGSVTLMFERA